MDHQIACPADRPLGHATPYSLPPFLPFFSSLSPINLKPMTVMLTLNIACCGKFLKEIEADTSLLACVIGPSTRGRGTPISRGRGNGTSRGGQT